MILIFLLISSALMSSKKIVRLKSHSRQKQPIKLVEETMATKICYNQLSTIMKVSNIEPSETLQVALINEINKVYRDIDCMKIQLNKQKEINTELSNDRKKMKNKLQLMEKQQIMFKSMYQLEKQNHERLRKFYQQRELQWIAIIEQQRRILEQYQYLDQHQQQHIEAQKSLGILSVLSKKKDISQVKNTNIQNIEQNENNNKNLQLQIESKKQLKNNRQLKKINMRNCISQPNQIYIDQRQKDQYGQESEHEYYHRKDLKKLEAKNLQNDDILDLIIRKIYHQNRDLQVSIDQISKSQDMIKLQRAKTSTSQRFIKTLKKLCHHQNQEQILIFCQSVQKQVINRHKILLGELIYNYLIQKLKQCQKLALTSNSILSKLDKNNSEIAQISNYKIPQEKDRYIQTAKLENIPNDKKYNRSNLDFRSITKMPKFQSVQKQEKIVFDDENIRYSISSLRNLSQLINGDTINSMQYNLINTDISIQ